MRRTLLAIAVVLVAVASAIVGFKALVPPPTAPTTVASLAPNIVLVERGTYEVLWS